MAKAYFGGPDGILDQDGFFDSGDIATLDASGFMQITDRSKDVIKSGGEWISSTEIENLVCSRPQVRLAAVIGIPHPRWGERPLLLVQPEPGAVVEAKDVLAYLRGRIAKWWIPDEVVLVDVLPLGATGKIDKKMLRRRFASFVWDSGSSAS